MAEIDKSAELNKPFPMKNVSQFVRNICSEYTSKRVRRINTSVW